MKREFKISDDSGFIGLANLSRYDSFISPYWDFEMLEKRIVNQINKNNIIFWSTGREDHWNVQISIISRPSNKVYYRTEEALIEVTNGKLHLVNYETLSMAAQFQGTKLPEHHLANLFVELENGLYLIEFSQLLNPEEIETRGEMDFELKLELIKDHSEYHPNDCKNIFWNIY
jgi:hypothetical protein